MKPKPYKATIFWTNQKSLHIVGGYQGEGTTIPQAIDDALSYLTDPDKPAASGGTGYIVRIYEDNPHHGLNGRTELYAANGNTPNEAAQNAKQIQLAITRGSATPARQEMGTPLDADEYFGKNLAVIGPNPKRKTRKPRTPQIPTKNYFFENLTPSTHVEERKTKSGKNSYYIAIIDGQEGTITMDGQKQQKQQKQLDKMVQNTKNRLKGQKLPRPKRGDPQQHAIVQRIWESAQKPETDPK